MSLDEIINISNDQSNYNSANPYVVLSRQTGYLYVIWHKSRGVFGGWQQVTKDKQKKSASIVYRVSADGGKSFSDTKTLYDFRAPLGYSSHFYFRNERCSDHVFLTWVDKTDTRKLDVYLARESTEGGFLDLPFIVSDPDTGNVSQDSDDLSGMVEGKRQCFDNLVSYVANVGNDKVYILWLEMQTTKTPSPIDEATRLELEKPFSTTNTEVWKEHRRKAMRLIPRYEISFNVFFKASMDGGKTFGKRVRILNTRASSLGAPYSMAPVSLVGTGTNVYVIVNALGRDPSNRTLRFFRSNDNGNSFQEQELSFSFEHSPHMVTFAKPKIIQNQPNSLHLLAVLEPVERVKTQAGEEEGLLDPFSRPQYTTILAKSIDSGSTFSNLGPIASMTGGPMGSPFEMSPDGKNVYIASIDPGRVMPLMIDIMKGKINPMQAKEEIVMKDTSGSILITASNDGGKTFREPVMLESSKHIGPVMEFGVNVILVPFGTNGLFALKTRDTNLQHGRRNEGLATYSKEGPVVQDTSEVLSWESHDGGIWFDGPRNISGAIGRSHLTSACVLAESGKSRNESNIGLGKLFITWDSGSLEGYSDVYLGSYSLKP